MFLDFFLDLKKTKIPVSLNEYLNFLDALSNDFLRYDIDKFYYLARASLVKDEKLIDTFDLVFSKFFKGIDDIKLNDILDHLKVPEKWVNKMLEKHFTKEEMEKIKSLGGLDKLLKTLQERFEEQKKGIKVEING